MRRKLATLTHCAHRAPATAQIDAAHVGDIRGALGTIGRHDTASRKGLWAKLVAFLAILGPGLIVMVGDNDAGAFSVYTQAGQNYGTTLMWTLLLLVPVLYVNQEMVLRLGAVTRVGHARLILERFGKFWGAFSVIDLLALNALTIVTEFVGITLALEHFGLPRFLGVIAAAAGVMLGAATGSFRRFERFALVLCFGSLLLLPLLLLVHAPVGQSVHDFFVPAMPRGADLGVVMLLIIGIVGTTIAPWQLFFQQSYVIDKRITTRWLNYERWDLALGIAFVIFGAFAMFSFTAATFAGRPEAGNFQDAGAVAAGIAKYVGALPGNLFALALFDASVIGASAVSLSTAYAVGDMLSLKHSLHRSVADAPWFYAIYAALIGIAAAVVLIPGSPLGLLTNAVQVLAGVLLPSATVFLLLLSNDGAVLGPWVNTRRTNVFTGVVIAVLVMLSVILTASTIFPAIGEVQVSWLLGGGAVLVALAGVAMARLTRHDGAANRDPALRSEWQMPPLSVLPKARLTPLSRMWMILLRAYLIAAVGLVVFRVVQIAFHQGV